MNIRGLVLLEAFEELAFRGRDTMSTADLARSRTNRGFHVDGETFWRNTISTSSIYPYGTVSEKSSKLPDEWEKHAMVLWPKSDNSLVGDPTTGGMTKIATLGATRFRSGDFPRGITETPVVKVDGRNTDSFGTAHKRAYEGAKGTASNICAREPILTLRVGIIG